MQVVWFKRDLRIEDHPALTEAARRGPVLPLYIVEPELWQQPDMSHRQYQFLGECLAELDTALQTLGLRLVIKVGDAVTVLAQLHQTQAIQALWSHQETGNGWTYARDLQVLKWTKAQAIPWYEPQQYGVVRRLASRKAWAGHWYDYMNQAVIPAPNSATSAQAMTTLHSDTLPSAAQLGLADDGCTLRQTGGRSKGLTLLQGFLYRRGEHYTRTMSYPLPAFKSCSRLSAHLAFGTLSVREVFQAHQQRADELQYLSPELRGKWPSALRSFASRLRWHCHFMQKLEDEPRLEFENLHPAYNDLRTAVVEPDYLAAWQSGHTGYPMIDACMRALIATGWLNFRMRAMLVSFASYHLWLPWREPALHLARLFTDYEPGIHYSQIQMQSGTTGINSLRIYNPIKQGIEFDPEGAFIRRWLPELADLPQAFIHTPWQAPQLLNGYPLPIVDEKTARQVASEQLYALRKVADHKDTAQRIVDKHATRRQQPAKAKKTRKRTSRRPKDPRQGELPF